MQYFFNDRFLPADQVKIGVTDLGFLRGYGIFDFFRVIDGQPIFLSEHLDRFEASAAKMHLRIPYFRENLVEILDRAIERNAAPMLGIKMILTGGYSEDGYSMAKLPNFLIMASPFSFKSNDIGMKLITAQHRRELPDIKTLNYAFPIRMLPDMRRVGADDLLYYDTDGQVSELSRSNVFIVKNGCIATPKDGVLYGITRKKTLEIARQHFSVEERPVTLAEVLDADEVFTTGSTKRITYIAQIDHQEYTLGDITRNLQQLLVEAEK